MNKKLRFIVPIVCVLTLSGCYGRSGKAEPTSPSRPSIPVPTVKDFNEIRLNRLNVGLVVTANEDGSYSDGESFQLEATTYPRQKATPTLLYSSSNEKVAKVSKSGLISAVAPGKCEVTVSSENGEVTAKVPVYVDQFQSSVSRITKVANNIKTAQAEAEISKNLDKLELNEIRNVYRTKNGATIHSEVEFEKMVISKSEAYFLIDSTYDEVLTEGGTPETSNYSWLIYTNQYYDTYLFHTSGDTKNYMVADSTSFIDQGKTPYDAMCAVLDSLFVSGSGIATRNYTDVLGTSTGGALSSSTIKGASKFPHRGTRDDNEIMYKVFDTIEDYATADMDDENDNYIPYGTSYDLLIGHEFIVTDNIVKSDLIYQAYEWDYEDSSYSYVFEIEEDYKIKDVELFYPNLEEYSKVDNIYDL